MTTTEPFGLIAWLKQTRVVLPLKGVECRFEATGPLVSVEMDQIFHQEHAEPLDCAYTFPLPAGAAVYRCEMHVNGRVISARIEEREAARKIYAEQKAAGHRAALVETERENLFTLSLGNIQPGDLVVVRFAYVQILERIGHELRVRVPVCPGVKYIPGKPLLRELRGRGSEDDTDQVPDASRISPPRIDALHPDAAYFAVSGSIAAVDVAEGTLSSPSHPILARLAENLHRVELANQCTVPDRDLVVRWEEPEAATLRSQAWGLRDRKQIFALLELRAPVQVVDAAENFEQDFYFLVDRSGSMEGRKWDQACAALHAFVSLLGPNDRVWITLFESDFGDFAEAPLPVATLQADRGFLELSRLGVAGGTELLPAANHVAQAIRKHSVSRRAVVILLTDGQVGNESEIVAAFSQSPAAAVHTFGIDTSVNEAFLKSISRQTGGECWLLTPDDDVAGTVAKLGHRLRRPVLSGLSVAKKWDPARDRLPDLFEGQAASVSLRGAAGQSTLQITGRLVDGAREKLSLELTPSTNAALRLIWARDRISALIDSGNHGAAIAIAKEHNLLCDGAAFIAWDEAEKVAIAEQEIYQPSMDELRKRADTFIRSGIGAKFLMCSPPYYGGQTFHAGGVFGDQEDDMCHDSMREPAHSSRTPLSEATEFFACHLPNLRSAREAAKQRPIPPAKRGQSLEDWISAMLRRRGAPDEFIQKLVAWLSQEFGSLNLEFPIRDTAFIAWMLLSAKKTTDDATVWRLATELVDAYPRAGVPTPVDFALWKPVAPKQKSKSWFR